jgi:hypothetical protein
MFVLFLYTIINAITSTRGFQNIYRVSFAGVDIGILETTVGLGILAAIILGPGIRARQPVDRTHPAYSIAMVLMLLGFVAGVFGSMLHDAPARFKMIFMREYFGMPASVFVGYCLVGTLRDAKKFPYAIVIAGVGVSIMLMAHFGRGAEQYELKKDWNALRSVSFVAQYAGVACGILIFSVLSGQKLFKMPIALAIAGFCFLGQLTPLHRSDWAALFAAIAALPLCLPPGSRVKHFLLLVAACAALSFSLWVGLHAASAVTGRNFHATFEKRLMSMLPTERVGESKTKAWDTRLPAIKAELGMWLRSPLIGQGFAIEESLGLSGAMAVGHGYHHNAYTSTLAQTGLVGFTGTIMAVYCPIFIGYKMVRQRYDRATMLIGALGIITGVQMAVIGMATASFNGYRAAMLIGLVSGIVFRTRDLMQTEMRLAREYGYVPGQDQAQRGFPVVTDDDIPLPDFDDTGRPIGAYHPEYN